MQGHKEWNSNENFPKMDLLNERIRVSFDISDEAYRAMLAKGSSDALGEANNAYLMGTIQSRGKGAHISVKALVEDVATKNEQFHSLAQNSRSGFDPLEMRDKASDIADLDRRFKNMIFLGDMRISPGMSEPSAADMAALVEAYSSNELKYYQPYIIGIRNTAKEGQEAFNFYRMVHKKNKLGYSFKLLERLRK